jgi:hypothetical protein
VRLLKSVCWSNQVFFDDPVAQSLLFFDLIRTPAAQTVSLPNYDCPHAVHRVVTFCWNFTLKIQANGKSHHPMFMKKYPELNDQANHCRNPDGKPQIWCFVDDPAKKFDYCFPQVSPLSTTTTTSVWSTRHSSSYKVMHVALWCGRSHTP